MVDCARLKESIDRHGERFMQRIFTPVELDYCRGKKRELEHLAGRFAAKEAVLKVLGTGWRSGISWTDIEVRNDPSSTVTLTQHKARESFVVEVMDLQAKVEALGADVAKRRAAASGEEATRLQQLEQRLLGGGGRGARGGGAQAMRQQLNALINAFVGSGARTGTMGAPTGTMRQALADAKTALAAIEKEIK